MSFSRDELLRPSLKGQTSGRTPYSVQTMFLTSFFGGPFAAIAIIGTNSVRLKRSQDVVPLGFVFVTTVGFLAALHLTAWGADLRGYVTSLVGPKALPYLSRVIGLVIFGIGYALHRSEQRNADFMELDRPNGWIGGIVCILAGIAVAFVFGLLITAAQRL